MKIKRILTLLLLSVVFALSGTTSAYAEEVTYYDGGEQKTQDNVQEAEKELDLSGASNDSWYKVTQSRTSIKENKITGNGTVNLIFSGDGSLANNALALGSGATLKLFRTENNNSSIGTISKVEGGTLYLGSGNLTVSGWFNGTNIEVNAGNGTLMVNDSESKSAISLNGENKIVVSSGTLEVTINNKQAGISAKDSSSIKVSGGKLEAYNLDGSGISLTGEASVDVSSGSIINAQGLGRNGSGISLTGTSSVKVTEGSVVYANTDSGIGVNANDSSKVSLSGGSTLQASYMSNGGTALNLSDGTNFTVNDSYLNAAALFGGETSILGGSNISVDNGSTGVFFLSPKADLGKITKAKNPSFGALIFSTDGEDDQWQGTAYGDVVVPEPGFDLYTEDGDAVQIGQVDVDPSTTAKDGSKGTISIPEGASLGASAETALGEYVNVNLGDSSEIRGGNQYSYADGSSPVEGGQLNLSRNITLEGTTVNNAGTVNATGFNPSTNGYTINNLFYGSTENLNAYNGTEPTSGVLDSVGTVTPDPESLSPGEKNILTYPIFFDVSKPEGTGAQITDLGWNGDEGYYTSTTFNGPEGSAGTKGVNTYIYGEELSLPGEPETAGSGVVATNTGFFLAGWAATQQQMLTDMASNPTFEWNLGSTKVPPALYLFGQFAPTITLNTSKELMPVYNIKNLQFTEELTYDLPNGGLESYYPPGNYKVVPTIKLVQTDGGKETDITEDIYGSLTPDTLPALNIGTGLTTDSVTVSVTGTVSSGLTAGGDYRLQAGYAVYRVENGAVDGDPILVSAQNPEEALDLEVFGPIEMNAPSQKGSYDKEAESLTISYENVSFTANNDGKAQPVEYEPFTNGENFAPAFESFGSDDLVVKIKNGEGSYSVPDDVPSILSLEFTPTGDGKADIEITFNGSLVVGEYAFFLKLNQEGNNALDYEIPELNYTVESGLAEYTVQASVSPSGAGMVNGSASFSQSYEEGSPATLRATPTSGWHFSGWRQNGTIVSRDNPMKVTVNSSLSYMALFARNTIITPSVTFTPNSLTLTQGQTGTVKVAVSPQVGYVPSVSSSDSKVATSTYNTATSEIIVTAVGSGQCQVMVYVGGTAASFPVTVENPELENIVVTPNPVYLAANKGEGFVNSQTLTLTSVPEGIDLSGVKVTVNSTKVATVAKNSQGQWTVIAVRDGTAEVTVEMDDVSVQVPVVVSSEKAVIDMERTTITADSPDFYTVTVAPVVNPAVPETAGSEIRKVSLFTWSQVGQTDIDCKVANDNGNGTWSYTFPVNNTPVNNYYLDASDIIVQAYASTDAANDGNMVMNTTWNYADCGWTDDVIVTPYVQNRGFIIPSVGQGAVAGTTGKNVQMEGVRISTPIEGLDVVYDVHAQNLGWMDQVSEGEYAGTMHANLQIEAVHIRLTGPNASKYSVQYQAHVENLGWMPWVQNGVQAGTTGRNLQLEALRIRVVPAGTTLPTN